MQSVRPMSAWFFSAFCTCSAALAALPSARSLSSAGPLRAQLAAEQRENLVQRFQEAYPETWQQELLKYDIWQQEETARQQEELYQTKLKILSDYLQRSEYRTQHEENRRFWREYQLREHRQKNQNPETIFIVP